MGVPGESWESKEAHRVIHQFVSVVSQCGAGAWLAEISADLREAVAHLRRVRDDVLYKSTVTLLTYFTETSALAVTYLSRFVCSICEQDYSENCGSISLMFYGGYASRRGGYASRQQSIRF